MRFDWDNVKNESNFKKHSIWFEEAQTIWSDSTSTEFFDPEHSQEEDRYIRIGHTSFAKLLLVVFCEKEPGGLIRIISARKATQKERKQYEEGI